MREPVGTMRTHMAEALDVRLAFWNVFLLKPRPIPGLPGLPAIGELAAPAVRDRAGKIGAAVADRFDIVAFSEAFEAPDRQVLLDAWGSADLTSAVGPGRSLRKGPLGFASSGLFSVVRGYRVTRRAMHQYKVRGSYLHDADALANKGVLLIEVDLGPDHGRVEVFSTHLMFGTGLLGGPKALDRQRRHHLRMAQLDELIAFVEREHRPGNALFVVGDFNVPAVDPKFPLGATAQYDALTAKLGVLGVSDLWVTHGSGDGFTCSAPTDDFAEQQDSEDGAVLIDTMVDPGRNPAAVVDRRERIDYVFADLSHPGLVVNDIRRYGFVRHGDAPARDRLARLSDHLAVGASLTFG